MFWNFTLKEWSTDGCGLVRDSNPPVCRCDHLSSFALLLVMIYRSLHLVLNICFNNVIVGQIQINLLHDNQNLNVKIEKKMIY